MDEFKNTFSLSQSELIFIYNALGYLANNFDFAVRAVMQTGSDSITETIIECDSIRHKLYSMLGYD